MSRSKAWRCALLGAAALFVAAGGAAAKTPDSCLKPDEVAAFETRTFQIEMQVYADACKALDLYNAMVRAQQTSFQDAAAAARGYFARVHGRSKANARQLEFETRYAAQAEMRRIRGMRTDGWFCRDAKNAMTAATTGGAAAHVQTVAARAFGKTYNVVQCNPPAQLQVAGLTGASPAAAPAAPQTAAAAPAAPAAAPAAPTPAAGIAVAAPALAAAPSAPAKVGNVTVPAPRSKPPVPFAFANRNGAVIPASAPAPATAPAAPRT